MFEIAKVKLNIISWICEREEYILYSRARQIAETVYDKYGINMFKINS